MMRPTRPGCRGATAASTSTTATTTAGPLATRSAMRHGPRRRPTPTARRSSLPPRPRPPRRRRRRPPLPTCPRPRRRPPLPTCPRPRRRPPLPTYLLQPWKRAPRPRRRQRPRPADSANRRDGLTWAGLAVSPACIWDASTQRGRGIPLQACLPPVSRPSRDGRRAGHRRGLREAEPDRTPTVARLPGRRSRHQAQCDVLVRVVSEWGSNRGSSARKGVDLAIGFVSRKRSERALEEDLNEGLDVAQRLRHLVAHLSCRPEVGQQGGFIPDRGGPTLDAHLRLPVPVEIV